MTTTPTKGDRSVWTYLMRTPFRQDYIDVRRLKTRYVEAGHPGSPAVFLLHGTGGVGKIHHIPRATTDGIKRGRASTSGRLRRDQ